MALFTAQRGADGDMGAFAAAFVRGRLAGFEKDIRICLSPVPHANGVGKTYAYFPALAACTSTLEYLTALTRGNTRGIGWAQVADFASEYMRQPDFDRDTVRVMFEALRHPVAHRGIASGVWVDQNAGPGQGRRVVWKISAGSTRPACQIVAEEGVVKRDSPWPCAFSHRVQNHLNTLPVEIRDAAERYAQQVSVDLHVQDNFQVSMRQLYPT
jgi:hypothetical protein